MRNFAKRLFGDDAARVFDLFAGNDDESGLAERVRRSGEWCGTVPGDGFTGRAARGATRKRPGGGDAGGDERSG
jgi:hypothetical protein